MVAIRRATLDDALRLAEVHVEGWRWGYREILPAQILERQLVSKREQHWREWLSDAAFPGHIWLAEEADVVCGLCAVGPARGTSAAAGRGEVYALYITEAAQGRGIGRTLMDRAVTSLREDAFTEAILWVLAANARGRAFYERCGWRTDGESVPWHAHGVEMEEIRYRVALSP